MRRTLPRSAFPGLISGILAGLLLLAGPPQARSAQDAAPTADPAREGERVVACDSLVALRQLSAGAHEDRARALAEVSAAPGARSGAPAGCRLVPRAEIGAVERRAMFGGAPYECLALASGGCLWVLP